MDDFADYNRRNVFFSLPELYGFVEFKILPSKLDNIHKKESSKLRIPDAQYESKVHLYDIDYNLRTVLTPQI